MWVGYYKPGETTGGPFVYNHWSGYWWSQLETDHFYSIENAAGSNYNDTLYGDDNSNWLYGWGGNDWLFGRGGADHLLGLDGDDELSGGSGADVLDGGDGIDTADYFTWASSAVNVSLETGMGYWGDSAGDTLYDIENLTGSGYDDQLVGDGNANVLNGKGGNDYLKGGGGADTLEGDYGSDTAAYGDSTFGVKILLTSGQGAGYGGDAEGDTLISIENLTGSYEDDTFIGNDDANVLEGLGGNDMLKGFGGADTLIGGHGIDTMYGGPGADHFVWEEIADTGITNPTMDTISDFNTWEDKIDVHSIDADTTVGGHQAFTFIGEYNANGGFTAPGQVAYTSDATDTYLIFNTDDTYTIANTVADFEFAIHVSGMHTPDANWFILP